MIGALEASDIGFIERTTSQEEGVVAIGSDPAEVAEGYDQIIPLLRSSTPEGELRSERASTTSRRTRRATAGWGHGRGSFETDGKSVGVRFTAVLHREDGEWKVVQSHASIGVPNDRMFDPALQGGAGTRDSPGFSSESEVTEHTGDDPPATSGHQVLAGHPHDADRDRARAGHASSPPASASDTRATAPPSRTRCASVNWSSSSPPKRGDRATTRIR